MSLVSIIFSMLLSALLVGCQTTSNKQEAKITAGEKERFLLATPNNYYLADKTINGNFETNELIPNGQKLGSWKEMLTIQIARGGINASPDLFSLSLRKLWKTPCPDSHIPLGKKGVINGYKYELWTQICNKNPMTNDPEFTLFKIIEGNDNFYIIQKAWKYLPSDSESINWGRVFGAAMVCDNRVIDRSCKKI